MLLGSLFARQAKIAAAVQAAQAAAAATEPPPALEPPPEPDPLFARLLAKVRSEPQRPDRDLPTLLAELGGAAANEVVLSKAHGHGSASYEAALESSIRMMDKWQAEVGDIKAGNGRGILISEAESETLRAAGAEDELSDRW